MGIGEYEALSVSEPLVNDNYKIYPNPAHDSITINSENGPVLGVRIFDVSGREVFNQKANAANVSFDISDLPSGVYLINVTTNKGENIDKLVIE